jgi:hypothetical protein
MPMQSKVNGLPRYRHQEMAVNRIYQLIWVEPRERPLAPVGEGFLFNKRNDFRTKECKRQLKINLSGGG